MKWIFGVLAILLLFGCVQNVQETNNVVNESNTPVEPTEPPQIQKTTVNTGDVVSVYYVLWVDGEIVETNSIEFAEALNYSGEVVDRPLTFKVDLNGSMIKGFVLNVLGMEINETKEFVVPARLGYGAKNSSLLVEIPRYVNLSSYENVSRKDWEARNLSTELGTAYDTDFGQVFVENVTNDTVTLYYVMLPGRKFIYNGIPHKVVALEKNYTIKLEYDLEVNKTYVLPNPKTGQLQPITILNKTNETILLDLNHPYAGKDLTFFVKIIDIR